MKKSSSNNGEFIFNTVNIIIMSLAAILAVYPFIYVLAASLSSPDNVLSGRVWVWPVGFELESYKKVLAQGGIWVAYLNTVFYAVFGTFVSLLITVFGAYPLSKKRLKGRRFFTVVVVLTLWFNAGIIPTYLNLRNLNMLNLRVTIILAFACSSFYVVLMKTYFSSISQSLEESAQIDGANDWIVLFRIYLPVSLPMLITIGLYYFVEKWNGYFWAMILLTDQNKIPLQVLLKKLIVEMTLSENMELGIDQSSFNKETIIYATIVVAVLPVVILYPFIQRFFVKGIMLGSIKE